MHHVFLRLFCLATVAFLASGCVLSEQPLSARADAKPDLRLVGTWLVKSDGNPPNALDAMAPDVVKISFDAQGTGHLQMLKGSDPTNDPTDFFITRTSQGSYLNLGGGPTATPGAPSGPPASVLDRSYLLARYRLSEDGKMLQLWLLKRDGFKEAITAGKLKGDFVVDEDPPNNGPSATLSPEAAKEKVIPPVDEAAIKDKPFYHVWLHDSSANLLKFIESAPEKNVFEEPTVCTKAN